MAVLVTSSESGEMRTDPSHPSFPRSFELVRRREGFGNACKADGWMDMALYLFSGADQPARWFPLRRVPLIVGIMEYPEFPC